MVEVCDEYDLRMETLQLAVNYLDRVLSGVTISRSMLQLVGITCLFLAAKYEEIHPPSLQDMIFITDNAYSKKQVPQERIFYYYYLL